MGWEYRPDGRRYLYRNRRVNGKSVKEYLAADDDFGVLMADDLRRLLKWEAKVHKLSRELVVSSRQRIADLLAATDTANEQLRAISDGLLTVAGYRNHHRGEWRMNRTLKNLTKQIAEFKAEINNPTPLVRFAAPANDAEAVAVYARARAGDADARSRGGELIRQRGWLDWMGDIAQRSTRAVIGAATAGDPVWAAAIEERVRQLSTELLGPNPSALKQLLVRRVVNGWVTVHALEQELAVRLPTNLRNKAYLDTAIGRAQKRMTQAIGELARVRRLQAPLIVAQLHRAPPVDTPPCRRPAVEPPVP